VIDRGLYMPRICFDDPDRVPRPAYRGGRARDQAGAGRRHVHRPVQAGVPARWGTGDEEVYGADRRSRVDESFQAGRTLIGLDEHVVCRWSSWRPLSLDRDGGEHAVLAVLVARDRVQHAAASGLVPLTSNDAARLLDRSIIDGHVCRSGGVGTDGPAPEQGNAVLEPRVQAVEPKHLDETSALQVGVSGSSTAGRSGSGKPR
jgi:hypothetical protein